MRGFCVITLWWMDRMVWVSTRTHATCHETRKSWPTLHHSYIPHISLLLCSTCASYSGEGNSTAFRHTFESLCVILHYLNNNYSTFYKVQVLCKESAINKYMNLRHQNVTILFIQKKLIFRSM